MNIDRGSHTYLHTHSYYVQHQNKMREIYVVAVYGSLLSYSTWLHAVDYDIYHCLFNMLYVLWLALFSNLCRGGGGLYCNISSANMHYYY